MRAKDKAADFVERQLAHLSPLFDKLFYFPGDTVNHLAADEDLSHVKEEFFTNKFSQNIHVWRLTCPSPRLRVIHFHGSGFNMSSHYGHVSWLKDYGCEVIMFDYPGYGRSTGTPTRITTVGTAYEVADKFSKESNLPTFILGQSLGGNIASVVLTETPRLNRIKGAVLDSMYSSFKELGAVKIQRKYTPKSRLLARLGALFISEVDAPLLRAPLVKHPLLVIHSRNDSIVPMSESIKFYRNVGSKDVEFTSHLDSGHTDVLQRDLSSFRHQVVEWMLTRKRN